MRSSALLAARLVLGGYVAAHGAQKLVGAFDGPGLDAAGQGFEAMGLTPGREMAALAGASEVAGGALTAAGVADPVGPITVASTMAVAATVHRQAGPLAANGGYELPLTYGALALVLAATGPGDLSAGPAAPRALARTAAAVGGTLAAVSIARLVAAGRRAAAAATEAPADDAAAPTPEAHDVEEPVAVEA